MLPNGMSRDANADASIPYYRLYVGNLFYSLTAEDIRQVFEPFGELAFVDLPLEPGVSARSPSLTNLVVDPVISPIDKQKQGIRVRAIHTACSS